MRFEKLTAGVLFLLSSAVMLTAQEQTPSTEGTGSKTRDHDLETVTIQAKAKRNTETTHIALQRKSVEVMERVSSAQLAKQGVGNAAAAVVKATGTVKQEGSNTIAVRGLLDRYNTTSLNGLPIPAEDPENKNIDLSLLKTDMVDFIALEKVYAPRLAGDFGGANIDIVSRQPQGKPFYDLSLGSSVNAQIFDAGTFYLQHGPSFAGFATPKLPDNPLTAYNFKNSWNFKNAFAPNNFTPINSELNLSAGKSFNINSGRLSTYFYAGFGNDYSYRHGREGSFGSQQIFNDFDSKKYSYATNTTAMVNIFYRINPAHQIKILSNYIHSSDQSVRLLQGYMRDVAEDYNAYVRRADFKTTHLFINQIGGDHRLSDKFNLNWIVGYNKLDSRRPERMTNQLIRNSAGQYEVRRDGGASNRYWDALNDNEFAGNINFDYKVSDAVKISFGYQNRDKQRSFESRQIDFKWLNRKGRAVVNDPNDIDQIFNAQNYALKLFSLSSNFSGPNGELRPITFDGDRRVNAGYINFDYKISPEFIVQAGLRFENIRQNIDWDTNFDTPAIPDKKLSSDYQKFLPALNAKYSVSEKQNLRLAASRTYTLPQLKEMAPFLYTDISEQTVGNPMLKPSDNYNLDLKWEVFPKASELMSITAFGKAIKNPIAKTYINSSDPYFSYLNVGDNARVFGVEAEFRKDLYRSGNAKFYAFANATWMNTQSDLSNEKVQAETTGLSVNFDVEKDKLQGAADFTANANLGWNHKLRGSNDMDLVISYSYVGEYLYSISTNTIGNIVQKPVNMLDATLRFNLDKVNISVKARNLINPEITRVQQNVNHNITGQYRNGREFGLSLGYRF